jgi:hypothetical protein
VDVSDQFVPALHFRALLDLEGYTTLTMNLDSTSAGSLAAEMALDDALSEFLLTECIRATDQAELTFSSGIAVMSAVAEQKKRKRSVAAHAHPGNLLDFLADLDSARPGGCVPESSLWKNLSPEIEDKRYVESFRLTKFAFNELLQRISMPGVFERRTNDLKACVSGQKSYTFRDILAMTLYFLAHCPTFCVMKNTFGCGLSTAWKLVGEGVAAIVRALHYGVGGSTPVIRFPYSKEEIHTVIGGFETFIGHLPMCMGAIDGTFIGMRKPDVGRCPMGRDQYFGAKSKITQVMV